MLDDPFTSRARAGRLVDPHATNEDRIYALCIHLSIFLFTVGFVVPVVAPLVMWLIKKGDSPFIDDHGREAVNFHISLLIYALISTAAIFLCGLGFLMYSAVITLAVVGSILGAVAAHRGEYFRYPACLRIIS